MFAFLSQTTEKRNGKIFNELVFNARALFTLKSSLNDPAI